MITATTPARLAGSQHEAAQDSLTFYTARGETLRKHAMRLKEMYAARAKKDTPTSDAIWAGFAALQEQAENNEERRLYWAGVVAA